MTARSASRGWPTFWNSVKWVYEDTEMKVDDKRPCRRCGRVPTTEGHDACLGKLPNVWSACCGHGEESRKIMKVGERQ